MLCSALGLWLHSAAGACALFCPWPFWLFAVFEVFALFTLRPLLSAALRQFLFPALTQLLCSALGPWLLPRHLWSVWLPSLSFGSDSGPLLSSAPKPVIPSALVGILAQFCAKGLEQTPQGRMKQHIGVKQSKWSAEFFNDRLSGCV